MSGTSRLRLAQLVKARPGGARVATGWSCHVKFLLTAKVFVLMVLTFPFPSEKALVVQYHNPLWLATHKFPARGMVFCHSGNMEEISMTIISITLEACGASLADRMLRHSQGCQPGGTNCRCHNSGTLGRCRKPLKDSQFNIC